ncbi:TetR/AcrR family transcriptional regulator [Magnetospirillum sp. SS-4]|uniref:TetR/AcrR family transcriptional regulator n=1 Tax=Magnetospirillum sp. SS-4 TaxID=2681465 RepID=UPI00137DA55E|nr:TetR/AcrR family transcriptional regulator [Magnetospirillum sp. SS-4]CAA7612592.1 Transcriptional regulator [Magnetospirillum sp. SS-4]
MLTPRTGGTRRSAKREAVLDAAQAVFLEMGYAAASMDSVAARAGVSKATVYAHFDSKDQLFAAVIRRRCDKSEAFVLADRTLDARAALTLIGRRLMDLLLSPEALAMYRVVVSESLRQPELAQAFYDSGPGAGKAQIAAIIAELIRRGELAAVDPRRASDQFVGMLRTDYFMRTLLGLTQPEGSRVDDVIDDAVETMLRAWGTASSPPR